jgi:hypothetical protein
MKKRFHWAYVVRVLKQVQAVHKVVFRWAIFLVYFNVWYTSELLRADCLIQFCNFIIMKDSQKLPTLSMTKLTKLGAQVFSQNTYSN